MLLAGREDEGAAAPSPLSAAAAFEAVALFRLWRSSSSSSKIRRAGSGCDDARDLALAERAAARAVSIACSALETGAAAPEKTGQLLAARRLCSLRHAAALAALGRRDEAAEALEAFGEPPPSSPSSSSPEAAVTGPHLAEARFLRELVSPAPPSRPSSSSSSSSSSASSSRPLAAALSALDGGGGGNPFAGNPFAGRVRTSALAALRRSLESLLSRGELAEARRLAEAEAEALEGRARAEATAAGEEEGRAREETGAAAVAAGSASAPLLRRSRAGGSLQPVAPPSPSPSAEAAAHAGYRLATLAYSSGDRDSSSLAAAALRASVALWGPADDRSWLRRHRAAAAALADEVLGLPDGRSSSSPSSFSSSSAAAAAAVAAAAAAAASPSPAPAPPPRLSPSEIEAEAAGALRRFRERLGGESGLAGEARLVSAAARLLRLREEGEQRRREGTVSPSSAAAASPSSPLAAFEAVLSPKREAEAAAEVQRGFREMIRGCSGGAEHPLVKRASEIREALLLLESKEKT